MKIDIKTLTKNLSEDERAYLYGFQHHIMNFKYLADDCSTWDDIIVALQSHIDYIKELKVQGAEITNFDSHFLFYEIPGEHAVFATLTDIRKDTYEFQLSDGTCLTTPIDKEYPIPQTQLGTRLVLLITEHGKILDYIITHDTP